MTNEARKRITNGCVRIASVLVVTFLSVAIGCRSETHRSRIPSEVEAVIATIGDDIAQERYEKVYNEASELWRQDASLEKSTEVLKTLRTRLGRVETRAVHTAAEQENSGGPLKGHAFIVSYQTRFERGQGMETFTLLEEDGSWKLARYLVNSTELR